MATIRLYIFILITMAMGLLHLRIYVHNSKLSTVLEIICMHIHYYVYTYIHEKECIMSSYGSLH